MLRLSHLTKQYGTGDKALNDVSLTLSDGETIALIGPSGAGKSTLIRCINRLIEPTTGEVWLDETEITGLGRRRLREARRAMAMIFQEYALIERLSVMENVLAGQLGYVSFLTSLTRHFPTATIQEAYQLLERVELAAHFNKRADELSGGQRQRVGIARAMLQHPALLLVDEPTASLDPRTSRQIMRLLTSICSEKGLSAIINIHDVALAKQFVPRIIGLRAGRIIFDGPPEALTDEQLTAIYGEEDWQASTFSQPTQVDAGTTEEPL
ncbi:MAG: phosphonate ABC transporter ATP-binding protein [Pseudomonadales bacterium]|nr:phosphonate ABC transporter ATP-binding protein [Pseudomonadales bacterium]